MDESVLPRRRATAANKYEDPRLYIYIYIYIIFYIYIYINNIYIYMLISQSVYDILYTLSDFLINKYTYIYI